MRSSGNRATQSAKLDTASQARGSGSVNGQEIRINRRRLLGAYYTPADLASTLVGWATEHATGAVLDPSYGGCAFLKAAVRTLAERGVDNPGRWVYGVDIDPACAEFARNSDGLIKAHCMVADFLGLMPGDVPGSPFSAIVGNPPYIRHHWLSDTMRAAARAVVDRSSTCLAGTASAWAYFLLHSLKFLAPKGRLAMLVPEAILQADYAAPLHNALAARFQHVLLVHIRHRQFNGTHEPVVVVAASGYGEAGQISIDAIESSKELPKRLKQHSAGRRPPSLSVARGRRVDEATIQLLEEIQSLQAVRNIADLATVRIGFVTGANSHFLRSRNDLLALDVPARARIPVLARTAWLAGLDFTRQDHEELVNLGARAFLVRPPHALDRHAGIERWISEGRELGVDQRYKCSKRSPWFRVTLPPVPDAFATCTRLGSPLLVLNRAGYRCSNALHSLRWRSNLITPPEVVAANFLTSAVAVWAEIYGRRYGGGVLKLEPGDLSRAPVALVPLEQRAFGKLNRLLREGREEDARSLADDLILGEGLGLSINTIHHLQQTRSILMAYRAPTRDRGHRA